MAGGFRDLLVLVLAPRMKNWWQQTGRAIRDCLTQSGFRA